MKVSDLVQFVPKNVKNKKAQEMAFINIITNKSLVHSKQCQPNYSEIFGSQNRTIMIKIGLISFIKIQ